MRSILELFARKDLQPETETGFFAGFAAVPEGFDIGRRDIAIFGPFPPGGEAVFFFEGHEAGIGLGPGFLRCKEFGEGAAIFLALIPDRAKRSKLIPKHCFEGNSFVSGMSARKLVLGLFEYIDCRLSERRSQRFHCFGNFWKRDIDRVQSKRTQC